MRCPYCGKEVKEGANFCPACGNRLEYVRSPEPDPGSESAGSSRSEYDPENASDKEPVYCPFCGGLNEADAQVCIHCGKDMYAAGAGTAAADSSKRRRIILIVIIIAACAAAAILITFSLVRRNNMHNTSAAWVEESDNLSEQDITDEDIGERELALEDITEVEDPDADGESSDTAASDSSGTDGSTAGSSSSGSGAYAPEIKVSDITFTRSYEDYYESAVVTAADAEGRVVWEYKTPDYSMTELDRTVEIGRNGDAYYLIQDTHLLALDVETGNVLWENGDNCGSPADGAFAFGEDAIYLSGYYGPDLIAISYGGETLKSIESFDSDYYWPYRLDLSGDEALIYFEGGPVIEGGPWIFSVDLSTWNYSLGGTASTSSSSGEAAFSMSEVTTVYASSYLEEPEYGVYHIPMNVIDGTLDNAWCEDASGQGIGEWLLINFDNEYLISGMNINAGYQKSEDLYYKNSRPKEIRVTFTDESYEDFTLSDVMGQQTVAFSHPVSTTNVVITILSVYPGSKYQDTLISEVSFY